MDFRKIRINQHIRAKEVRVIDETGNQLGIMPVAQALKKAQELGYDLIEIAPQATPPVCKIMDFSKFKYLYEKKEREKRRHQRLTELKEIYIRPSISEHDLEIKLNHIKEFLLHSHPTKITINFTGREIDFMDQTVNKLVEKISSALSEIGNIEPLTKDRNKIVIMITPKKK